MNRKQRLLKAVPGADSSLIDALATLPASEVTLILAALRQARRDERQQWLAEAMRTELGGGTQPALAPNPPKPKSPALFDVDAINSMLAEASRS